jgi:hypothetical protein
LRNPLAAWDFGIATNVDFYRALNSKPLEQERGDGGTAAAAAANINSPIAAERNLWDDNPRIPPWMIQYFTWHKSERERLVRFGDFENHRYLVLRCLAEDYACGGASDRLRSLPYILMLANQTRRLLFIYWSRPAPLQEFLVPPLGGLDWTIPPNLLEKFTSKFMGRPWMDPTDRLVSKQWVTSNATLLESRFSGAPPVSRYNAARGSPSTEPAFEQVYGEVWRILFEPSSAVSSRIQSFLVKHGMVPHKYVSVHVRAQYFSDATGNQRVVENALRCAASRSHVLQPPPPPPGCDSRGRTPIFLASDSADVSRYGVEYGKQALWDRSVVVSVERQEEPLHLDRGRNFVSRDATDWDWEVYNASAYYDTFVDLYLLSMARCVLYGVGGYGRWASWISTGGIGGGKNRSSNASCSSQQHSLLWCPPVPPPAFAS